jgi:hypothetical protein
LSVFQSVADEEGKGDEIEALSNQDHVITRINGRCYDITGELIDSMGYQPISDDEVRGYELMIYGSSDHWIKSDELSGVFDTPITDNTQEEK